MFFVLYYQVAITEAEEAVKRLRAQWADSNESASLEQLHKVRGCEAAEGSVDW